MASDDKRISEFELNLDLVKSEPELDTGQQHLEDNPDENESEKYGETELEMSNEPKNTEVEEPDTGYNPPEVLMDGLIMPKEEVFSDEFDDAGLSTSNVVDSEKSPYAGKEEIKQECEYDEQFENLQEEEITVKTENDDYSYQDKHGESELMTDDSEPDLSNFKEEICSEELQEEIPSPPLSSRQPLELYRDGYSTVIRTGCGASLNIMPMSRATEEEIKLPIFHSAQINITSGIMAGNSEGEIITDIPRIDIESIKNMLPDVDMNSLLQPRFFESAVDRVIENEKNDKKYACSRCTNTYKQKSGLNSHIKVHNALDRRLARSKLAKSKRKIYKCVYCKKIYMYITSLETHERYCNMRVVEPVKPLIKEYECSCGQKYVRKSRLEACIRLHANPYACRNCSAICLTRTEYTQHRKEKHTKQKFVPKTEQFPCKLCPAMFVERKLLWKHLKKHQRIQIEEIERLSLAKQEEEDESKQGVEINQDQDEPLSFNQEVVNCDQEESNHKQEEFNYDHNKEVNDQEESNKYVNQDGVVQGRSEEKSEPGWNCSSCNASFSCQYAKNVHEQRVHTQRKKSAESLCKFRFMCPLCTESFLTLGALTNHKITSHKDSESCSTASMLDKVSEQCVKSEKRTERLNVIPPINYELMCVHCRKFCASTEALTSHLRFHSLERKFPCKFCGFRFSTIVKRKTHELLHKGDLKYVCFICEYRCSSPGRIKLHKNSQRHEDTRLYVNKLKESACNSMTVIFESETVQTSEPISEPIQNKVEGFPCDVCEAVFPDEEKMSEHKFATHPFIEFPNDASERIFFK